MATPNAETTAPKPTTTVNNKTEELKVVFDQFDANGDGKISASELGEVLKSTGSSYTKEDLRRVIFLLGVNLVLISETNCHGDQCFSLSSTSQSLNWYADISSQQTQLIYG